MNELEDIKLKALLQEMKLESPNANFSTQVMNRIFEESNALESIKSQSVLGRGFWIIIVLFLVLLLAAFVIANTGAQTSDLTQQLLPSLNGELSNTYSNFFSRMGSLPLSIGGILVGASVLLFIDRIISSNQKLFTV